MDSFFDIYTGTGFFLFVSGGLLSSDEIGPSLLTPDDEVGISLSCGIPRMEAPPTPNYIRM